MALKIRRPAGNLEQYSLYRSHWNLLAPVIVTGRYSKALQRQPLFAALSELIEQQPCLCVTVDVDTSSGKADLVKLDSIDLDRVVSFVPEMSLEKLVNNLYTENDIAYNQTKDPLWRLIILHDDIAVFVFDHVILDGTSGAQFHMELLEKLNKNSLVSNGVPGNGRSASISNGTSYKNSRSASSSIQSAASGNLRSASITSDHSSSPRTTVVVISDDPIPPSMEQLADIRPPLSFALKILFKEKFKWMGRNMWPGFQCRKGIISHTSFGQLNRDDSDRLVKLARKNKTTVTGVMLAVLTECAKEFIPREYINNKTGMVDIMCEVPINMRGRAPLPSSSSGIKLGNIVSASTVSLKVNSRNPASSSDLYRLGYDAVTAVKNDIRTMTSIYYVGALQHVSVKNYVDERRKASFLATIPCEVSNLGVFDGGTGPYQLKELYFNQANNCLSASFVVSVVSIRNGPLNYTISLAKEAKNDSDRFMDKYSRLLMKLINEEEEIQR